MRGWPQTGYWLILRSCIFFIRVFFGRWWRCNRPGYRSWLYRGSLWWRRRPVENRAVHWLLNGRPGYRLIRRWLRGRSVERTLRHWLGNRLIRRRLNSGPVHRPVRRLGRLRLRPYRLWLRRLRLPYRLILGLCRCKGPANRTAYRLIGRLLYAWPVIQRPV